MKTNCINCGVIFEDQRPNAFINLVRGGITDEDILKGSLTAEPYCPECSEEATRLLNICRSITMAASRQAEIELKRSYRDW